MNSSPLTAGYQGQLTVGILLVYSLLRTIDDITVGVWDVMGNFKLFSLTKLSVHSFKEENVACSPTVDLFVHQSFV